MFEAILISLLIGGVVGAIWGTLDGKEAKRKKKEVEDRERAMAQYERERAQAAKRENEYLRAENARLHADRERVTTLYERRRAETAQRENECLREENERLRAERDVAEEKCSNLERKRQLDKDVKRIIRKSRASQASDEYRILKKYGYVTKWGPTSRNLEADLHNETSPIHKEFREKGYFS